MGSNYFWEIFERKRIILLSSLLLWSSKFVYILTGKYHSPKAAAKDMVSTYLTSTHDPDPSEMWNLDRIGIFEPPNVKGDDKVLEEFNRTVCNKEQRY